MVRAFVGSGSSREGFAQSRRTTVSRTETARERALAVVERRVERATVETNFPREKKARPDEDAQPLTQPQSARRECSPRGERVVRRDPASLRTARPAGARRDGRTRRSERAPRRSSAWSEERRGHPRQRGEEHRDDEGHVRGDDDARDARERGRTVETTNELTIATTHHAFTRHQNQRIEMERTGPGADLGRRDRRPLG